jgi:putative PEP-CTERM system TPR-repeat lipoprotein
LHKPLGEIIELQMNRFLRCLSVLLFGAVLLACDEDPSSEDHLNTAKTFLEKSDPTSAIVELKNALKMDVNNSRASALLGELNFEAGEYEDAKKELSRALTTGGDTNVITPMLAKVLLSLGEFERLDALGLDGLDPEGRSVVQAAKGLSMIYRKNPVVAAEIMDAALQNEPHSPYADVAAARLLMEHAALDDVRSRLTEVIAKSPEYAPAWNLLGDIESAQLRPKEAVVAYTNVIKFSGDSFNALLNRAMMSIYLGDFQGAQKDLVALGTAFPSSRDHPGVQFASGLVYLQNKQLDPARKVFFQASEYSDNYPQTRYYLATIDLEQGLVAQALSNAYKFLGLLPGSVVGAKLVAKLELGQKGYKKAEKLLLPVVAARPDDIEALNLLASAMLAQGKGTEGVELLTRSAALQPDSMEARARLGAALLGAGSDELGIQTLRDLLARDPGYEQADVLIVLNYLRQLNQSGAIQAALEYQERNPSSATSYYLLGRAYVASGEHSKAKSAFNKALELRPGDPGAGSSLADFALSDKDYEAARNYYRQVLEHYPDHMQTRLNIAASYAVEGKEQEMLETLQSILTAYPRAMEPRLVKVRYYIAKGQLEKVIPLFDELTADQKEYPDALVTIAAFELAANRYNQALVTLEKLLKVRPDVGQYHYMKSRAYAGLGEVENLAAALERTVKLDPDHFYARIALARLALLSSRFDRFQKYLNGLMAEAPDNPDVMKLEILSAQRAGDNESALRLLERVFAQEPTTGNVIALAVHHQSVGNLNGAITQLQRWVRDHADDVKAREKLAEMYGSNSQVDDVVSQYREILTFDPEHVVALNNLAWNLLEDNPRQALDYAQQANQLSPDSGPILDTLAMAQMKKNDMNDARKSIDRARTLAPDNPEIAFHEAQVRAAEGDKNGAIDALNALLAKYANFSKRGEAAAFLTQLKNS